MRNVPIVMLFLASALITALISSPTQAKIDDTKIQQCSGQWERLHLPAARNDIGDGEAIEKIVSFFTVLGNDLYYGLSVKDFFEICASNKCFDERANLVERLVEGKRLSQFCLGKDKGRMRLGLKPSSPECGERIEEVVFTVKYGLSAETRREYLENVVSWQTMRIFLFGFTENVEQYFEQCWPFE